MNSFFLHQSWDRGLKKVALMHLHWLSDASDNFCSKTYSLQILQHAFLLDVTINILKYIIQSANLAFSALILLGKCRKDTWIWISYVKTFYGDLWNSCKSNQSQPLQMDLHYALFHTHCVIHKGRCSV